MTVAFHHLLATSAHESAAGGGSDPVSRTTGSGSAACPYCLLDKLDFASSPMFTPGDVYMRTGGPKLLYFSHLCYFLLM